MQAFAAIILAGGQSRRMGTDKARLRVPLGGPTLIERVGAAARTAGVHEVIVVGGNEARVPAMDARFVRDAQPGAGPLAGLATGLAAIRHDTDMALVLACDLPYLSVPLLQWMIAQPDDDNEWDALVPFLPDDGDNSKGGWQPLHALYTRACLAPIRAALDAGERRMTAFFPHIRVRTLTADAMRLHDPALQSTHSVNTPDAWAEAARWLTVRDAAILSPQEHGAGDEHDTKDAMGK